MMIYQGRGGMWNDWLQYQAQMKRSREEAEREAGQKVTERRKFLALQRMAYLASGVNLSGTPGIVAEETFKEFQNEIEAIRKSGILLTR